MTVVAGELFRGAIAALPLPRCLNCALPFPECADPISRWDPTVAIARCYRHSAHARTATSQATQCSSSQAVQGDHPVWGRCSATMSHLGQKAKYSLRAHIIRCAPESGLKADIAGGPFRARKRHRFIRLKVKKAANLAALMSEEARRAYSAKFAAAFMAFSICCSSSAPNLVGAMSTSTLLRLPS